MVKSHVAGYLFMLIQSRLGGMKYPNDL